VTPNCRSSNRQVGRRVQLREQRDLPLLEPEPASQSAVRYDEGLPGDPAPYNTGHVFATRIENTRHGVTVRFDERSTGFVWFFSFLVWFSQMEKTYGKKLVILLDEPGLSLHGKAQADLLRYINEKLLPTYQVIYTTHSPFMIDAANVSRSGRSKMSSAPMVNYSARRSAIAC